MRVVGFLQKLFAGSISPKNLGGPISIAAVAGSEASQGIARLLMFLTFLSANLAILNFLPIPALDGGHMVFLLAEGIRGKPVDERMQVALTLAGVACLLGLMIFVIRPGHRPVLPLNRFGRRDVIVGWQGRQVTSRAVASRLTPRQRGPLHPKPAQRPPAHRHCGLLVPPYHAMNPAQRSPSPVWHVG